MREIIFRGKSRDTNKWVFGDFVSDARGISHEEYLNENGDIGYTMTYVIPETIGQYTGLTDKNGKKIFEGDIVTSDYYLEKDKTKNSIIEYGEWNCSCCNGVFGWVSNGFIDFRDDDVLVIGNIHDNPELLKEG